MAKGIDISEFQGDVDFDSLKSQVDFVFIRSSFGVGYIDSKFIRNRDESRRVGLVRGFYHYAYPQYNSPEEEANYFISVHSDLKKDELLALDLEEQWNGDNVDWCLRFLKTVEGKFKFKPLIYLNLSTVNSLNWASVVKGNYGLWLAVWDGSDSTAPATPWPVVAFKQYTSSGAITGISGNVDLDSFFGDVSTIKKYGYQPVNSPTPTKKPKPINLNLPVSNPVKSPPAIVIQRYNPTAFNFFQLIQDLFNWFVGLFRRT